MDMSSVLGGLMLVAIGAVIWMFKWVGFVANNFRGREVDREGLARWIGLHMITMGIIVAVVAVIQYLIFKRTYLAVDAVIIITLSMRMAWGAARFAKPLSKPSKKSQVKRELRNKKR